MTNEAQITAAQQIIETAPIDPDLQNNPLEEAPQSEKRREFIATVSQAAHIEVQEDLAPILAAHQAWKVAVLDPKSMEVRGRANFRSAQLSGLDLSAKDLSYANFQAAQCIGTDFRYSDLSRCNFRDANLRGADLRACRLAHTDFSGADVEGAIFDPYTHIPPVLA